MLVRGVCVCGGGGRSVLSMRTVRKFGYVPGELAAHVVEEKVFTGQYVVVGGVIVIHLTCINGGPLIKRTPASVKTNFSSLIFCKMNLH